MASQKLPNCGVALQPSSLRRTVCTPHSSGFARIAFVAFWLAISLDDFFAKPSCFDRKKNRTAPDDGVLAIVETSKL